MMGQMNQSVRHWDLLQEYVTSGSEEAFAQIVRDHVDMVYSACLRQVGRRDLAEEVTQAVFIILSKKARLLPEGTVLGAWLHKTARYTCLNALKVENRRRIHERKAAQMAAETRGIEPIWNRLSPMLDEGIAELNDKDRAAILLRFFDRRSMAEVGQALGVSEDAAGMRVSRAVDKLRSFFQKNGVRTAGIALTAVIANNAVRAAPASLPASISSAVAAASVATGLAAFPLAHQTLHTLLLLKLRTAALAATLALSAGGGLFICVHHLLTRAAHLPTPASRMNDEESTRAASDLSARPIRWLGQSI